MVKPRCSLLVDALAFFCRHCLNLSYLLLAGGSILANTASADFVLWDEAAGGNGHYYGLVLPSTNPTWQEARDAAANTFYQGRKGHLLTVTSEAEHNFIRSNWESTFVDTGSANATWAWIGLTDEVNEGDFRWITGEALSFTAWHELSGQPNNETFMGQDEDYAHYWRAVAGEAFTWNDSVSPAANANNGLQIGYFVEFSVTAVPEPSSLALTGVPVLLFLVRRHRCRNLKLSVFRYLGIGGIAGSDD